MNKYFWVFWGLFLARRVRQKERKDSIRYDGTLLAVGIYRFCQRLVGMYGFRECCPWLSGVLPMVSRGYSLPLREMLLMPLGSAAAMAPYEIGR